MSHRQVLVRFTPDGKTPTLLGQPGPEGLSQGTPHGLRIEHEEATGSSFLYHCNNGALLFKTTLDGEILWQTDLSGWKTDPKLQKYTPIVPTDAIVVPGTNHLLVADGYGSSFVHVFDKNTGQYTGKSFGGKGNSTKDPIKFNTPHGIAIDPRRKGSHGEDTFVISDRSNGRLVWINATGHAVHVSATTSPPGMSLPCNVDVQADAKAGMVAVVPSLGVSYTNLNNGAVAIYDSANDVEPLSVIEVAKLTGHLGHQHPHDAMFLPNGDIIVCCWSGPPNTAPKQGPALGTISYWKRLGQGAPAAPKSEPKPAGHWAHSCILGDDAANRGSCGLAFISGLVLFAAALALGISCGRGDRRRQGAPELASPIIERGSAGLQ
jgi:hypothetical protein